MSLTIPVVIKLNGLEFSKFDFTFYKHLEEGQSYSELFKDRLRRHLERKKKEDKVDGELHIENIRVTPGTENIDLEAKIAKAVQNQIETNIVVEIMKKPTDHDEWEVLSEYKDSKSLVTADNNEALNESDDSDSEEPTQDQRFNEFHDIPLSKSSPESIPEDEPKEEISGSNLQPEESKPASPVIKEVKTSSSKSEESDLAERIYRLVDSLEKFSANVDLKENLNSLREVFMEEANVEAIQKFLASSSVRDLVVDISRNGVESYEEMKPFLKTHFPFLLSVLAEVLKHSPKLMKVYPKIMSFISGSFAVDEEKPTSGSKALVVHEFVECDSCAENLGMRYKATRQGHRLNGYIAGVRYRSAINNEFDLCETCEKTGDFDNDFGPFLKIKSPSQNPEQLFCVFHEKSAPEAPQEVKPEARFEEHTQEKINVKDLLKCRRGHEMLSFLSPTEFFMCDSCNNRANRNEQMFGCRSCDFDLCVGCMVLNYPRVRFVHQGSLVEPRVKEGGLEMEVCEQPRFGTFRKPIQVMLRENMLNDITMSWRVQNTSSFMDWPGIVDLVCTKERLCFGNEILNVRYKRIFKEDRHRVCTLPKTAYGSVWMNIKGTKFVALKKYAKMAYRSNVKFVHISTWRLATEQNKLFGKKLVMAVQVDLN